MQKLKWLLSLPLIVCLFLTACEDNDPLDHVKKVNVAFAGRIIDESGAALPGALVKAGDELTLTDENGVFRLASTKLPADAAILSVSKNGYFDISRAYIVQENSRQNITIQLLSRQEAGSVNNSTGGVVTVPGGAQLGFPANAVADLSGNVYNGSVRVLARFLDPTSPNLALNMPGDLRALNTAGEPRSLATFGMIGVELEGGAGQRLQVAAGKSVEVRIPIDASIVANAPAQMPLWHFDLEKALWIEDGVAQKVGNEYVGNVQHFSWWNYDAPYPSVIASGKVYLNDLQHPLAGAHVWFSPVNQSMGWGSGHGETDANGCYMGAIPKDMPLTVGIMIWSADCNMTLAYTADVGPFSSDVAMPDIIINQPAIETLLISGKITDCNGQPVTNGYAKITLDNNSLSLVAFSDANGDFEVTHSNCGVIAGPGKVKAYDLTNALESAQVAFNMPPNTVDVGNIQVCTALSEYIEYTLDGQPYLYVDPQGSVSPDSFPATGFNTWLSAATPQQNFVTIGFHSPTQQTGTFALTALFVSPHEVDLSQSNLSTTVTATGNVGDFIIGTFGTTFKAFDGSSHTISGSYRVIRDW